MSKAKFEYLKMASVVALLAIAFVSIIRPSAATNPPLASDIAAPVADTTNEERVIGKFLDDYFAYQIECHQVSRRQGLRTADIDPLQRKSQDLQNRLTEVQNAARDIVTKLKSANEFDKLDALVSRESDPRRRAFLEQSSFKADLEYAAANLTSHRDEIGQPLEGLRRKVAANGNWSSGVPIVKAAYRSPTMMGVGLGCRLGQLRLKLISRNGGNIDKSPGTCDAISCACNPNSGGLCTGANCPNAGGAAQ